MLRKSSRSVTRLVPWLAVATLVISMRTAFATDPAPTVQIVVHDGYTTVVAGCSEPDCMGSWWTASQVTGTVTHAKNYVYWMIDYGDLPVYLYVDDTLVTYQTRNKPMIWSIGKLSPGSHTLVATSV